jgi:ABC-type multidrug transport system fused ATPase/permease subunit
MQIYYAGYAAARGTVPFQFAAVSALQGASWSVQWKLQMLLGSTDRSLAAVLAKIADMYAALAVRPDPTAGGLEYPAEGASEKGVGVELRDVTFQYPGAPTAKAALRGVSVKIEPGQLVVIVGENGSGKSTFVKVRLFLSSPCHISEYHPA